MTNIDNFWNLIYRYGVFGIARLTLAYLFTRVFFPGARLVRFPIYLRGRSNIRFGKGLTTGVGVRIDAFSRERCYVVEIGNNVQINDYVHIGAISSVKIGNDVLIASKVFITDHNHGRFKSACSLSSPVIPPIMRPEESSEVSIGDRVWIGENVSILPGVVIGSGSIVGAGSVVTKSVPENVICAGVPAKVIKVYDFDRNFWASV